MPIVAVAVCPHPPLLVPQLSPGHDRNLAELRSSCADAVDQLADVSPDLLVIVGADSSPTRWYPQGSRGSFAGFGRPVAVDFAGDSPEPPADRLPLPLLAGGWLAQHSRLSGLPCTGLSVSVDTHPADCRKLGRELSETTVRTALLVLGDGAARHSEHSPVHLHPRAEEFDAVVADALAKMDTDVLLRLDPALAQELSAAGRAAWQVLAGVVEDQDWHGELTYAANPYGVGYFVGGWKRS